jgi:hypothetical protein
MKNKVVTFRISEQEFEKLKSRVNNVSKFLQKKIREELKDG